MNRAETCDTGPGENINYVIPAFRVQVPRGSRDGVEVAGFLVDVGCDMNILCTCYTVHISVEKLE